jgi:DNA-binding CsgD family transcriptional regulator
MIENPGRLTASEIEIVKLIASGLTAKEIALKRHISFHTVNTHRKNIFRKLGVSNSSELIMLAIKSGWIDNIEYYI